MSQGGDLVRPPAPQFGQSSHALRPQKRLVAHQEHDAVQIPQLGQPQGDGMAGTKGRFLIEDSGKVKFRRKAHDFRVGSHYHHPFHLFCRDSFHGPPGRGSAVQGSQELIFSIASGTAGGQEHAPQRFFLCHGRIPPFHL